MNENNREATRMIQKYLRELSYKDPDIPSVVIDGIFDIQTRNALKAFQLKMGLTPTGICDITTFELLYNEYTKALKESASPEKISVFPIYPDGYVYKIGDRGYVIGVIKYLLRELSAVYDIKNIEIDLDYNKDTEDAIKEFQEKNGLTNDGCVNMETWNALAREANALYNIYFGT